MVGAWALYWTTLHLHGIGIVVHGLCMVLPLDLQGNCIGFALDNMVAAWFSCGITWHLQGIGM